jgi:transcription elongation factor GreA
MPDQIVTKEGYEKLKKELEQLTKVKRREIAERIQKAKDMGDLSENAEYSEAKDEQALNEGRIVELEGMLKNVTVVENGGAKGEVNMGSRVTVRVNKQEKEYIIVSFNEVDPIAGKISNESPLGRAFLGRKEGSKVKVETPKGEVIYEIIKVE